MKTKDEYIAVHDLQIRVRPIPHWSNDPTKHGGFSTTLIVGGGNGIHLGGPSNPCGSAQEVAQWLLDNPEEYDWHYANLVKSNLPIPQSYLDMCKGKEL